MSSHYPRLTLDGKHVLSGHVEILLDGQLTGIAGSYPVPTDNGYVVYNGGRGVGLRAFKLDTRAIIQLHSKEIIEIAACADPSADPPIKWAGRDGTTGSVLVSDGRAIPLAGQPWLAADGTLTYRSGDNKVEPTICLEAEAWHDLAGHVFARRRGDPDERNVTVGSWEARPVVFDTPEGPWGVYMTKTGLQLHPAFDDTLGYYLDTGEDNNIFAHAVCDEHGVIHVTWQNSKGTRFCPMIGADDALQRQISLSAPREDLSRRQPLPPPLDPHPDQPIKPPDLGELIRERWNACDMEARQVSQWYASRKAGIQQSQMQWFGIDVTKEVERAIGKDGWKPCWERYYRSVPDRPDWPWLPDQFLLVGPDGYVWSVKVVAGAGEDIHRQHDAWEPDPEHPDPNDPLHKRYKWIFGVPTWHVNGCNGHVGDPVLQNVTMGKESLAAPHPETLMEPRPWWMEDNVGVPESIEHLVRAEREKYPEVVTVQQRLAILNDATFKAGNGWGLSKKTGGAYVERKDGVRVSTDVVQNKNFVPPNDLWDVFKGQEEGEPDRAIVIWSQAHPHNDPNRPWVAPLPPEEVEEPDTPDNPDTGEPTVEYHEFVGSATAKFCSECGKTRTDAVHQKPQQPNTGTFDDSKIIAKIDEMIREQKNTTAAINTLGDKVAKTFNDALPQILKALGGLGGILGKKGSKE